MCHAETHGHTEADAEGTWSVTNGHTTTNITTHACVTQRGTRHTDADSTSSVANGDTATSRATHLAEVQIFLMMMMEEKRMRMNWQSKMTAHGQWSVTIGDTATSRAMHLAVVTRHWPRH